MAFDRLGTVKELSQNDRLLQVETALESEALIVQAAEWVESVSGQGPALEDLHERCFAPDAESALHGEPGDGPGALCPFLGVIDAISGSGHLSLTALMGEQVTLRLRQADGAYRTFHGYVVMASHLGSDNGRSLFRLGVAAFTHFMTLRRDSRVFVQQSVMEVVQAVLGAYPQANFRLEVSQPDEARGIVTQYGETDAAFVARLLAEMGWNWYLAHEEGGPALSEARSAKHCLVITDARRASLPACAVRFNRAGVLQGSGQEEDTVTHLSQRSEVRPTTVTVGSWDPGQLAGVQASAQAGDGKLPALEVYLGHGERGHAKHDAGSAQDRADTALAQRRASVLLAQERLQAALLHGQGTVRQLKVFSCVQIEGHDRLSGAQARQQVVSIHHRAANKLSVDVMGMEAGPAVAKGTCVQMFTAVGADVEIVPPAPRPGQGKPMASCETAVVVGWEPEAMGPVSTNRDLQLRIQFPWQRGDQPLAGGLPGPQTPQGRPTGHAPGTGAASVWVRVAQPIAGPNWGAHLLARLGTEVLVGYIDGDIDRPVIVGQLHSEADPPPWPVGENANHAGVLSGMHSHSHAGPQDGVNQWVMDDSAGQLRMRLASGGGTASAWSELSLGHLVSHGKWGGDSQRGAWLGAGYCAHTDGWAVVRAQEGLLASTAMRAAAAGSAQGTQMDAREAVQQLQAAQALGGSLNEMLGPGKAVPLESLNAEDPAQALETLRQAIDPEAQGKFAGAVGGQEARPARAGSRVLEGEVAKFGAPHLVMQTAAALLQSSEGPLSGYSGMDTSLATQGDLQLSSAHTVASVSGQTTSLYNQQGPMQFITANADFSLAAHTDALELLADKLIAVHSVEGDIVVLAKTRIELRSGDTKVVLEGADIAYHCNEFVVRSSTHEFSGADGGEVGMPTLPDSRVKAFDEGFIVRDQDSGEPLAHMRYRIKLADGTVEEGITDAAGATHVVGTMAEEMVSIELIRR
jgi:type VI secretion system secreted protein VgrG